MSSGKGSAPKIVVYANDGRFVRQFAPYAATFLGGLYVSVGDVDGDGSGEIVTGTGAGGGPHVRVFTGVGEVQGQFFAYDSTARHGVRVAVVDTDRDGIGEIVTTPGSGTNDVRIFNAAGIMRSFWPITAMGNSGAAVAAW